MSEKIIPAEAVMAMVRAALLSRLPPGTTSIKAFHKEECEENFNYKGIADKDPEGLQVLLDELKN